MRHGMGFFRLFVPSGLPGWLLPLIVPIEILSYLIRPLTLAVRLFANMVAGHMAAEGLRRLRRHDGRRLRLAALPRP